MTTIQITDMELLHNINQLCHAVETIRCQFPNEADVPRKDLIELLLQAHDSLKSIRQLLATQDPKTAMKIGWLLCCRIRESKKLIEEGWPLEAASEQAMLTITYSTLPPFSKEAEARIKTVNLLVDLLERRSSNETNR